MHDSETFGRDNDADDPSYFHVNCNHIFEKAPAMTKEILGKVQAEMVPKKTTLFGYEMKTGQLLMYAALCIIFLFSTLGATVMWFTDTFDNYVMSQLVISNETDAFRMWQNPSAKALYSFHLFNYTNIDDYEKGKKENKTLRVEEVGPYVYLENLEKFDISFNEDGSSIKYRERRSYTYRQDLSKGLQSDTVVVPNIPLISGSSMVKKENYFTRMGFSGLSSGLEEKAFLNVAPESLILGYEDQLYTLSANYLRWQNIEIPDKVGLMAAKIGEAKRFITMNTGKKDMNRLGLMQKLDEKDGLGLYSADSCNSMEGTDGAIFPPKIIGEKQPIHFMLPEFCRRMPMVFRNETTIMDGKVLAYQYTIPDNVFDTPETNPENECFCVYDDGTCPLKGLFNTQGCSYGSPIYLSNPHFFNADQKLLENIVGLDPVGRDYRSYFNIHPTMGFMMTGRTVMQVNIKVNKAFGVSQTDMFQDGMVLPIAWIDVFLDEPNLPQEFVDIITFVSVTLPCIQLVVKYGTVLTSLFCFISLLLVTRRFKQDKNCCLVRISTVAEDDNA